jgi:hypothetical protein
VLITIFAVKFAIQEQNDRFLAELAGATSDLQNAGARITSKENKQEDE